MYGRRWHHSVEWCNFLFVRLHDKRRWLFTNPDSTISTIIFYLFVKLNSLRIILEASRGYLVLILIVLLSVLAAEDFTLYTVVTNIDHLQHTTLLALYIIDSSRIINHRLWLNIIVPTILVFVILLLLSCLIELILFVRIIAPMRAVTRNETVSVYPFQVFLILFN